jgi:hypothetical protein
MHWQRNKLGISSVLYFCLITILFIIIGTLHNFMLSHMFGHAWLIYTLLILSILLASSLYLIILLIPKSDVPVTIDQDKQDNHVVFEQITDIVEKQEMIFHKEAFISGIIPGENLVLNEFCEVILRNLADKLQGVQGIFYLLSSIDLIYKPIASYAYFSNQNPPEFKMGETIPGQAVKDQRILIVQNIPDNYIKVVSGLGNGNPKCILMLPVIHNNKVLGLIEMATFKSIDSVQESALKEISGIIAENIVKLTK